MNIRHEDFEKILHIIKDELRNNVEFEEIRSIESNFDTKGVMFKGKESSLPDGTIIVGEDDELIAVDVSMANGKVTSFVLENINDKEGIKNIINWFETKYEYK
jgi:hypothetical protein